MHVVLVRRLVHSFPMYRADHLVAEYNQFPQLSVFHRRGAREHQHLLMPLVGPSTHHARLQRSPGLVAAPCIVKSYFRSRSVTEPPTRDSLVPVRFPASVSAIWRIHAFVPNARESSTATCCWQLVTIANDFPPVRCSQVSTPQELGCVAFYDFMILLDALVVATYAHRGCTRRSGR